MVGRYEVMALATILLLILTVKTSQFYRVLSPIAVATYQYPKKSDFATDRTKLFVEAVSKEKIEETLVKLVDTTPERRSFNGQSGIKAVEAIRVLLDSIVKTHPDSFSIETRSNRRWKQPTLVFKVKGKTPKLVVVGCHTDSANLNPFQHAAPGVDDDLSGVAVLLEALRVLAKVLPKEQPTCSLEFHFYSAEEIGSQGSRDLFNSYRSKGKEVVGMMQQDMAGFKGTGKTERFGLVTDYSSAGLSRFTRELVESYCKIPVVDTTCGKMCSDQVSALMYGYPAVYPLESTVEESNPHIHSLDDTLEWIDYNHMAEHAKLVSAFISELGYAGRIQPASVQDRIQFNYWDFIILLVTAETKRFCVAALCAGMTLALCASLLRDYIVEYRRRKLEFSPEWEEAIPRQKMAQGKAA